MCDPMNRQIRLKSRPAGMPSPDNFETVDSPMPALRDGDVLRRTTYLSLDPYMRGRMSDAPSYSAPVNLHDVMCCRAVGIAGSPDKCRYVVEELGFDACINYKTDDLVPALRAACPGGADIYFENVGGKVFAAVLSVINRGARIPLCGMISEYNTTADPGGPN